MFNPATVQLVLSELEVDRFHDDVTGKLLGEPPRPCEALVKAKQAGVFSGEAVIAAVAQIFAGTSLEVSRLKSEGDYFVAGDVLVRLSGDARTCLALERTLVNFLSHLCGVATQTNQFVQATQGSKTRILATRKTLPGLRDLQLQAVMAGGGFVHRRSLSDGILIKENHQIFDGEETLLARAQAVRSPLHRVEIEVQALGQLERVLKENPDLILLDNLDNAQLAQAMATINGQCKIEVSGGVDLERVATLVELGVDYISVGRLTHSASVVDLSMDFIPGA